MHPMHLRLPQEVTENIIDCVAQDGTQRCLKAFSLVAKAWLPRSRYHLFRRLRVFISTIDPDALEDLLLVLQRDSLSGYAFPFLPAVEFVEELDISDPFRTKAAEGGEREVAGPNVFCTLLAILRTLPQLRTLKIDAKIWLPDYQIPAIPQFAPRAFKDLCLGVDSDLRVALSIASSVNTLCITATVNAEQAVHTRAMLPFEMRHVPVGTLVVTSGVLRAEYASTMHQLGQLAAVEHLKVECDGMTDWGVLSALLQADAVASNVRSITLDVRNCNLQAPPDFSYVRTARFRRLETIAIQGLVISSHPQSSTGFAYATSVLDSWPTHIPHLSTLNLNFLVYDGPGEPLRLANDAGRSRLEAALSRWRMQRGLDLVVNAWSLAKTAEGGSQFLRTSLGDLNEVLQTKMEMPGVRPGCSAR